VDGNVRPILGGARQTKQESDTANTISIFYPAGIQTHEVYFEQPSFITSGATSVVDQYVLHLKCVLANATGFSGIYRGESYSYDSFGKIKVTLENSGGSQVLLHHKQQNLILFLT
jgi:hypothetical protein